MGGYTQRGLFSGFYVILKTAVTQNYFHDFIQNQYVYISGLQIFDLFQTEKKYCRKNDNDNWDP